LVISNLSHSLRSFVRFSVTKSERALRASSERSTHTMFTTQSLLREFHSPYPETCEAPEVHTLFSKLARELASTIMDSPALTVALRQLLVSRGAAVTAKLFMDEQSSSGHHATPVELTEIDCPPSTARIFQISDQTRPDIQYADEIEVDTRALMIVR
jgi:hypothetical protein